MQCNEKSHKENVDISPRNGVGNSIVSTARINIYYNSGGKKKKNTSLFIYSGQIRLSIKNKIHTFLIHSRLMLAMTIVIYNRRVWKLETAYIIQS